MSRSGAQQVCTLDLLNCLLTFDDSFTSTTCLYLSPSQLCLTKRESNFKHYRTAAHAGYPAGSRRPRRTARPRAGCASTLCRVTAAPSHRGPEREHPRRPAASSFPGRAPAAHVSLSRFRARQSPRGNFLKKKVLTKNRNEPFVL